MHEQGCEHAQQRPEKALISLLTDLLALCKRGVKVKTEV